MKGVNSFRRMVMPGDMNPGNRLFGGRITAWIDEGAAIYALCQLLSGWQKPGLSVVTVKISEIVFVKPVHNGDILEFWCENEAIGHTSLTVACKVVRKNLQNPKAKDDIVTTCSVKYVLIDEFGKSHPHGLGGPPA